MSKLQTLRKQLHWTQFARQLGAEGPRRVFNQFGVISYAQTGEDLLIASLLSWPRHGYYVDVGCHHPIRLSNTYLLYLNGLRGLAIDANAEFRELFNHQRPHDKFVTACVGDEGGLVDFNIFKDRALSSIGGVRVDGISGRQYELERIEQVPLRSLNEIFMEHDVPEAFEVLSIDVERHDFSALKSLNLERFRPRLIVIELHGADPSRLGDDPVAKFCSNFGYVLVAYQRSNAFFVRNESQR